MNAGRELDALVAEKVMGLVPCTNRCHSPEHQPTYCYAQPDSPDRGGDVREYSTDMGHAWEVVEKLVSGDVYLWEIAYDAKGWHVDVAGERGGDCRVEATAPLAICLSALKAVGYQCP